MAYLVKKGRSYDAELLRSFDSMVHRVFGTAGVDLTPFPAVDVREADDSYTIEVELPGYSQDDVNLELKDGVLSISSVARDESEKTAGAGSRRARPFARRFSVPKDVDVDRIDAAFTNGLLVVTLNKQPEAQPRKIEILSN
jgi:HSP20 family protein